MSMSIADLETKTVIELRDIARELDLAGYTALKKQQLIFRLLQAETERQGNLFSAGILNITDDGIGYLRRDPAHSSFRDVYVSPTQIRRFCLCTGALVSGQARLPKGDERYYGLLRV